MIKNGFILLSILLLLGCSSKESKALMKNFQSNKNYFSTLQKTEKMILSENNQTKVVVISTYLKENKKKYKYETFIVGIYFEDYDVENLEEIFHLSKETNTSLQSKNEKNISIVKAEIPFKNKNKISRSKKNKKKIKKHYYGLTLNTKYAVSIDILNDNDERLKGLSFFSPWMKYALVKFKYNRKRKLNMIFESKEYGKAKAVYSKVAKYAL